MGKRRRSAVRHDKRRRLMIPIKIDMGGHCVDCGNDDLEVLEFDHVAGDKVACVRHVWSETGMLAEAAKCALRCVNCHRKRTFQNSLGYNEERTILAYNHVLNIKLNSDGCQLCGWYEKNHMYVLDFDHLDQNNKLFTIANMVKKGRLSEQIDVEIAKCRLLCANCHRKHTLRQMGCHVVDIIANALSENMTVFE